MNRVVIIAICLAPTLALAVDTPPPGIFKEHPAAMSWLFGLCFLAVCFFIIRTLNQNEKQHTEMMQNSKEQGEEIRKAHENNTATLLEIRDVKSDAELLKYKLKTHTHRRAGDPTE